MYHQLTDFTRMRDFTWRVSDCEELMGLLTGDDVGSHTIQKTLKVYSKLYHPNRRDYNDRKTSFFYIRGVWLNVRSKIFLR